MWFGILLDERILCQGPVKVVLLACRKGKPFFTITMHILKIILPIILCPIDQRFKNMIYSRTLFPISLNEFLFILREFSQFMFKFVYSWNVAVLEYLMNDAKYGGKPFNP